MVELLLDRGADPEARQHVSGAVAMQRRPASVTASCQCTGGGL